MKRDTPKSLSLSLSRFGRGGFTLVELMIAVAIIAILAAFLAPSVATYVRRSKGQAAANELANVLRAARNQAMSRGEVIIATVTTRDGVNGGGSILLERVDADDVDNTDCDAVSDSAVSFDTTTDPDCFARSCAEAQTMSRTTLHTLDLSDGYPDMVIQGTDPAPVNDELELCFSPSGRVLGQNGLPMESDSTTCDAVNARFFVRLDEDGATSAALDKNPLDSAQSLSSCIVVNSAANATLRQTQKDGRDVTNYYSITVPFNGAISVKQ
jgi:prepilin-type N-terminal cleavage/methylation domain-containing protein